MTMEFAGGSELWEPPGEDPNLAPNQNHRHTTERCAARRARREAIQHVMYLSDDVYCESSEESSVLTLRQETRAALHALGVTAAEIDEAEKG
jgi:hypothetical protein